MALSRQDLEQLVQRPRESLDTGLKQWIDPATPAGRGIVARACLALRNNNGGYLIFGIRDNGTPDPAVPADVRAMFHGDVIQQIVGDFASQPFAVVVEFIERDGVAYPVICVPSGIETPVAAKRDLPNAVPKKQPLVKCDAVYVRTIISSNTVSSSPARAADWPQLVRHCFDNREADIGAFIRRHLPSLSLSHLSDLLTPAAPSPTASELAGQLLDAGRTRFAEVMAQRGIAMPNVGTLEAAVVVDGSVPNQLADQQLLFRLQANRRDLTGWPFWVSLQGSNDQNLWPYHFNGGWECLIAELDQADAGGTKLDFWRIDPAGKFYHLRGLEDDMHHPRSQSPRPERNWTSTW